MPAIGILGAVAAHKVLTSVIITLLGFATFNVWQRPETLLTFTQLSENTVKIKMISYDFATRKLRQSSLVARLPAEKVNTTFSLLSSTPVATVSDSDVPKNSCSCPATMFPFQDVASNSSYSCGTRTGVHMSVPFSSTVANPNFSQTTKQEPIFYSYKYMQTVFHNTSAVQRNADMRIPTGAVVLKSDDDGNLHCHNLLTGDISACGLTALQEEKADLHKIFTSSNISTLQHFAAKEQNTSGRFEGIGAVLSCADNSSREAIADSNQLLLSRAVRALEALHFKGLLNSIGRSDLIDASHSDRTAVVESTTIVPEGTLTIQITSETIEIPNEFSDNNISSAKDAVQYVHDGFQQPPALSSDTLFDPVKNVDLIEQAFIRRLSAQHHATNTEEYRTRRWWVSVKLSFMSVYNKVLTLVLSIPAERLTRNTLLFLLDMCEFISCWINFQTLLILIDYAVSFWLYADAVIVKPLIQIIWHVKSMYSYEQLQADMKYLRADFISFLIISRHLLSIVADIAGRFFSLTLLDQLFCSIAALLAASMSMMPFLVTALPVAELFVWRSRAQLRRLEAQLNEVLEEYSQLLCVTDLCRNNRTMPFTVIFRTRTESKMELVFSKLSPANDVADMREAPIDNICTEDDGPSDGVLLADPLTPPPTDSTPDTPHESDADGDDRMHLTSHWNDRDQSSFVDTSTEASTVDVVGGGDGYGIYGFDDNRMLDVAGAENDLLNNTWPDLCPADADLSLEKLEELKPWCYTSI